MRRAILIIWLLFVGIPRFSNFDLKIPHDIILLEPMEALDLVKEAYASNFIKISLQENHQDYFYKLEFADYYLVYEDTDDTSGHYLFHLYEFVIDDIDTGIGHTVTYGWYWVDPYTGDMWEYP